MSEPIPLSPSSISDLFCPHKFQQLRILRRWSKQHTQSTFVMNGRAAHAVFAELFDPRHGSFPPHAERLENALRHALASEPYPDEAAKQMAAGWISGLVNSYLDFLPSDRKTLAVEQTADFPLHYQGKYVAQVSARLDRVDVACEKPETLIVVDIATGDKPLHLFQAWITLAAAKSRYKHLGFRRFRLEIHSVSSDEVQVASWQGSDLKGINMEVGRLAAEFQHALEQGQVEALSCEACLYCHLKTTGRCPLQVAENIEDLGFDDE